MTLVIDFHPPQIEVSQGKGRNGRTESLHISSDGCSYGPS